MPCQIRIFSEDELKTIFASESEELKLFANLILRTGVKKYDWCRVRQAKHSFESNFSYEVESMAKSALINILSRACKCENVTKEEVLAVEKLYFDLPKLKTLFSLNANRQGTPQEFVLGLQDAFLDKPKDGRKKKNDNWF